MEKPKYELRTFGIPVFDNDIGSRRTIFGFGDILNAFVLLSSTFTNTSITDKVKNNELECFRMWRNIFFFECFYFFFYIGHKIHKKTAEICWPNEFLYEESSYAAIHNTLLLLLNYFTLNFIHINFWYYFYVSHQSKYCQWISLLQISWQIQTKFSFLFNESKHIWWAVIDTSVKILSAKLIFFIRNIWNNRDMMISVVERV